MQNNIRRACIIRTNFLGRFPFAWTGQTDQSIRPWHTPFSMTGFYIFFKTIHSENVTGNFAGRSSICSGTFPVFPHVQFDFQLVNPEILAEWRAPLYSGSDLDGRRESPIISYLKRVENKCSRHGTTNPHHKMAWFTFNIFSYADISTCQLQQNKTKQTSISLPWFGESLPSLNYKK